MVEANTVVVRDKRMAKRAPVNRWGKIRTPVDGLLITLAKRKEQFVLIRKTMIDAHGPGGVQNRIDGGKEEIIRDLILVSRGGLRDQLHDVLRHRAAEGNLIV